MGKPSRALRNPFAERAIVGSSIKERRCIANCLQKCLCRDNGKTYCLLQALAKAGCGDIENGLIFSGANVKYTERIMSVTELMTELTQPHNFLL